MDHRSGERGVALILVLVILPLVAIIMTQLHFETTVSGRLAGNVLATQQFKQAIRARRVQMVERLLRDLKQDEEKAQQGAAFDHVSEEWGTDTEGGGTASLVTKGDAEHGDDVMIYTEVVDEQGKFNLNLLRHNDPGRRSRSFEVLRNLLDFFRDARYGDVEDNSWDLSEPEAQEVAEAILKFVRGEERDERVPKSDIPDPHPDMKQGIFTIDDLSFCHRLFREKRLLERFTDLDSAQILPGLREFLTIYGDGKVNANTAPIQLLRAMFREVEGQQTVAGEILRGRGGFLNTEEDQDQRRERAEERDRLREEGDEEGLEELVQAYKSVDELGEIEVLNQPSFRSRNDIDLGRDFTVRSNFFTIVITARRGNHMRQHRIVIERHLQGHLTWETEVRAPDLIDLPQGAPSAPPPEE